LHKEGIRYFILLSFVVFKSGTVVKGHIVDDHLGRNRSLGVLLMSNFNFGSARIVEGRLETLISDD
jgi:hypothetical protein